MDCGELPALELAFPGPERDSGVAAILAGTKTALTGLLQILEHAAEPVPEPGQRFSVLDSAGPRSEGIAEFLGATPVIDDGTLVVTERFRLIRSGDSPGH